MPLMGPAGRLQPPGFDAPSKLRPIKPLLIAPTFEYGIPASIDDTGASDVTSAINSWISSLPDGAIARFGINKTYRILGTIVVNNRNNITFNGNGSTFNQNTAPAVDNLAMWEFDDCTGILIRDMKLVGAFATPGTYNATFEHNHGIALFGTYAIIDNVRITNVGGDLVYYGQGFTGAKNPSSGGWTNSFGSGGPGRNAISYVSADGVHDHNLTFTSTIGLFGLDAEPNTGTNFYVNNVVAERIDFNCNIHSTTLQVTEGNPVSNVTYKNITTTDVQGVKVNLAQILGQTPIFRPQNITLDGIACPTQYTNSSTWVADNIDGLTVINLAIPMWCVTSGAYLITATGCTSITQSNNDRTQDAGPNAPAAGTINIVAANTATGSITLGGSVAAKAPATATGSITLGGTATSAYTFVENFDSGSPPFGFDTYSGSGSALDTTNMLYGAGCMAVSTAGTLSRTRFNAGTLPATGALYYRFYLKVTSTPSGTSFLFKRAAPANANLVQVAYNTALALSIRDNTGSALGGSYTLTANAWYRVEVAHDMSGSTMQMKVWSSPTSTGTPDFDSGSQTTTGTPDLFTFGQDANITSSHLLDAFAISSTTWVGPLSTSATAPAQQADVTVSAPFDTSGGEISLTLIADNPIDITGSAGDAVISVGIPAQQADVTVTAYDAVIVTTAITATGSITLGGSASGKAVATATGSLSLGGSVTAQGSGVATGAITLGGSAAAKGAAVASGSVVLGGSVTAGTTATASGSITLGGSAFIGIVATGSITLGGSANAQSSATAAGSITLGGTGQWIVPLVSGSITLGGTSSAKAPASAAGSITLGGTASIGVNAVGSITLGGTVIAQAPVTAAGSITLNGTAAWVVPTVTGSIVLGGTANWRVASVTGSITLDGFVSSSVTGNAAAVGTVTLGGTASWYVAAVGGSITLGGSAAAKVAATAIAFFALDGSAAAKAPATASGSITFSGIAFGFGPGSNALGFMTLGGSVGTVIAYANTNGSITFNGSLNAVGGIVGAVGYFSFEGYVPAVARATASGSIALNGTASAYLNAVATAAGSISFSGGASSLVAANANGSISLVANASVPGWLVPTGSISIAGATTTASGTGLPRGSIVFEGYVPASAPATSTTGSITFSGSGAALSAPSATGSIAITASATAKSTVLAQPTITLGGSVGLTKAAATVAGSITLLASASGRDTLVDVVYKFKPIDDNWAFGNADKRWTLTGTSSLWRFDATNPVGL